MQPDRPALSQHRVQRLTRWTRLWFAACLAIVFALVGDTRAARRVLDTIARVIGWLVFLGVAARMTPPLARASHRHGVKKHRGLRRALLGARVRRALRGKDAFARLASMACALRDLDRHIATLAKRLRQGLTRRRLVRCFKKDGAPAFACARPAYANTS